MRPFTLALAVVLAEACAGPVQGPDVTAVAQTTYRKRVVGRTFHPAVVVVLDRSAAMGGPLDAADPACPPGCGAFEPCPAACRTRLDEARAALSGFIDGYALDQRLGLVAFPADDACGPPATPLVTPLPIEREGDDRALARSGEAVKRELDVLTASGGAPVGDALRLAASLPAMNEENADHIIVLVTAGAPACDGRPCSSGCLDLDDVAAAIRENAAKRIQTVVVVVGKDSVLGARGQALNALATAASGFRRGCNTTDNCGEASVCQADRTCSRNFFLTEELEDLFRPVINNLLDLCGFHISEAPARPEYLQVQLDGVTLAPGPETWSYAWPPEIRFEDSVCARLKDSTPANPIEITIRVLEFL